MNINEFEAALTKQCNAFTVGAKKKSEQDYTIFYGKELEKIQVNVVLEKMYKGATKIVKGFSATVNTEPKTFTISTIADKVFENHNNEEGSLHFRKFFYD